MLPTQSIRESRSKRRGVTALGSLYEGGATAIQSMVVESFPKTAYKLEKIQPKKGRARGRKARTGLQNKVYKGV